MMASLKLKQDKKSNTINKLRKTSEERNGSKGRTQIYTTKLHKGPTIIKMRRTNNSLWLKSSNRRKRRSLRCQVQLSLVQILSCQCPKTSFLQLCPCQNKSNLQVSKHHRKNLHLQRKTHQSCPCSK